MGLRRWIVVALLVCVLDVVLLIEADVHRNDEELGRRWLVQSGRILVESGNVSEFNLTRRTQRIDPLDHLKKYKGGFNITSKHYWSSAVFTGKFGYIIGAVWLLGGLIYAAGLLISLLCSSKNGTYERKRRNSFKRGSNFCLIFTALFTLLAIITSGMALGGSSKFHSRAITVKNIVLDTANNASGTIYTVTEAVKILQNDSQLGQNVDSSSLELASKRLNDEARRIERKAEKIMYWVSKGLNMLNAITIATVSLNIAAILVLLVSGALRLPRIVRMLIILCWLLTFLLWAYFGLYFFFGKFAGDVCIALDEYKQNPEKSTLSSILPCNDRGSAATTLHDVSGRIHDLIEQVNSNITSLKSSFPELRYICNPFSGPPEYNYQAENCSSETITIGQIPQVIENFACSESNEGGCKPGEFIPAHVYDDVQLYTKSMQDILDSYPVMKSLIDCQLVKDAFSNILFNQCQPLKKNVHLSWASLAVLSTVMVILILIWESETRRNNKLRPSDGSVQPSSTPREPIDVDEAEEVDTFSSITLHKQEP